VDGLKRTGTRDGGQTWYHRKGGMKTLKQLEREEAICQFELMIFEVASSQIKASKQPDLGNIRASLRERLTYWRKELARTKAAQKGKR